MQRRDFLSTAAALLAAPAILAGRDKSGLKTPVIGEGDHKYECHHGWGNLPKGVEWQTTHGVCVDAEGLVYIKQQGLGGKAVDSIHVFETIRFLTDAFNLVDLDVSSLQESEGLLFTRTAKGIRAFRFWMKLIFGKNISVSLNARRLPKTVFYQSLGTTEFVKRR